VATEDRVIGVVLTQWTEEKEYIITYISRRLIDVETRYTFIEKLCLSLYCACTKLRHYLLSSACIVTCQADVIKHMLQKLILSRRIRKWAYAFVEYDLAYESLKSVKDQIVADFIVEHRISDEHNLEVNYITCNHGKYILMGRFVMMGEELILVMFLSLQVVSYLNSQTGWKNFAQIIKLNMKHSYLAWNFCNPWV